MRIKSTTEYKESGFISELRAKIYAKKEGGNHGPSCSGGLTYSGPGPCNCGSNANTSTNCSGCGASSTICQK